jgi:aldehyde:ferredoxin oxidoreductase
MSLGRRGLGRIASDIINLARSFNQREGVTRREDKLPRRFFREVLGEARKTIRPEDLELMLKEYYALRGWS